MTVSSDNNKQWYVLHTRPQTEKKVASYLEKQDIEYYLPLVNKKRSWSDRIKFIDFPLFPGYIFAYFDFLAAFPRIIRHPGAVDCIREKGKAAVMKGSEMENLKLLVKEAKNIYSDPDKNFPAGQKVIVRSGALRGLEGFVARVKNKERIYVHLPLLNRVISTELDIFDLEKAY